MSTEKNDRTDLPQRDPGATLDPADRAQLIINRESIRAEHEKRD